mmetsp:Transcript_50461/g.78956  ORF Transcript_50461/g.78956 Transcript_50461/m.78956 type:complete len:98 (+) Transcript_50461:714-1007(+)
MPLLRMSLEGGGLDWAVVLPAGTALLQELFPMPAMGGNDSLDCMVGQAGGNDGGLVRHFVDLERGDSQFRDVHVDCNGGLSVHAGMAQGGPDGSPRP